MLIQARIADSSAILPSALVTRLDIAVIMCRRMGSRRSEGPSTRASDPISPLGNHHLPPSDEASEEGRRRLNQLTGDGDSVNLWRSRETHVRQQASTTSGRASGANHAGFPLWYPHLPLHGHRTVDALVGAGSSSDCGSGGPPPRLA